MVKESTTPEKSTMKLKTMKTSKFQPQNPLPIRAKGSNLGLQMNIHMSEVFIDRKPKLMEEDEKLSGLDAHKLKLINYEKKLLNEKKIT